MQRRPQAEWEAAGDGVHAEDEEDEDDEDGEDGEDGEDALPGRDIRFQTHRRAWRRAARAPPESGPVGAVLGAALALLVGVALVALGAVCVEGAVMALVLATSATVLLEWPAPKPPHARPAAAVAYAR